MLSEGAELTGESGKTYLAVSPLGQANVWTAVDTNDTSNIVIIKEPGADDTRPGWPNFQNEMIMHELLKDCKGIRKQVDRIPPSKAGDPPMLVLEIFETTLWGARSTRPLSGAESKSVMKDALKGLHDVHARGQVYADLKMPNIMVDGFDSDTPSDHPHLTAKLGDLGIVMAPANGKIQPISYRAPEVYFKGAITSKADIWSWGLIYCHLLEAQHRFSKTGLYDDLDTGSGTMQERESAVKSAMSNDYEMQSDAYFRDGPLPPNDKRKNHGDQWEELRRRGLVEGEVDFLRWVMRADPRKRPSAAEILRTGWLDMSDEEVAAGFVAPVDSSGRASMEFDPRRSSPADVQREKQTDKRLSQTTQTSYRPTFRTSATDGASSNVASESAASSNFSSVPWQPTSSTSSSTPAASSNFSSVPWQPTSGTSSSTPVASNNTSSVPWQPTPSGNSSASVQSALDEVYAARATYKRNLSHTTAESPAEKRTYASQGGSKEKATYAPQRSSEANVTQYINPDSVDTSTANAGSSSQPVRPGFSTQNTGTFLSYR